MPEASAREAGTAQGVGDLPAIDERLAERLSTLDRGFNVPEQTRTNRCDEALAVPDAAATATATAAATGRPSATGCRSPRADPAHS